MNSNSSVSSVNLKELTTNLASLAQLESEVFASSPDQGFLDNLKLWRAGLFRIVVMGEIKQGKSSFINALLGVKDLVPVNSDVATSTIFKIRYGKEKRYRVFFTRQSGKPEQIIDEKELHTYGTEDGNPDNSLQVDFIEVCVPSPLLGSGIVIVDTPGLGGLFKKHKEITYQYAPKADAVFFVTDSIGSPLGLQEIVFLKELGTITDNIYFVQTKADAADTQMRQARMQNNVDILVRQVGFKREEIRYFIVDSPLKLEADDAKDHEDLTDSGFPPLMAFIQNSLRKNQRQLIAGRAMLQALPKLERVRGELTAKKGFLDAETEAQQKQLGEQIQSAQADFKRWNNEEKPRLLAEIQKSIGSLRLDAMENIRKCQPGGEIQQEFEHLINQAQDVEQLEVILSNISSKLPEFVSNVTMETGRMIQERAETELLRVAKHASLELSPELNHGHSTTLNRVALERQIENIQQGGSIFEDARTGLYGGIAGVTIASVVGGIIGSIIPVVGTIIGSGIGMAIAGYFGGSAACNLKKQQELRANKQQASNGISQTLSSAYSQAQSSIERILQDIQHAAGNAIQTWVSETQTGYERQIAELAERKNMSNQQLMKKRSELAGWESCLQQIERSLPLT
jgi:hypothetical protein